MVELKGLEPLASCMPCKRSSQLSYSPTVVSEIILYKKLIQANCFFDIIQITIKKKQMDLSILFKVIGALGLIFITIGVITKNRVNQNICFIIGGLLLEAYSIFLKDPVFIPLQIIFVAAAAYELYHLKKKKK